MQYNHKQISEGLRARDLSVYKEIYFLYHGRLVLFARKFTGDIEIARDIVQDAFLNLWEKSDSLEITISPKAYLFQAVRNRALNFNRHVQVRQNAKDQIIFQIDAAERAFYNSFDDPYQSLLELELDKRIECTISSMPDKCKEVFELSRQSNLKNKEIANQMGISVKMVEKYISKALRILRTELSDYVAILLSILFSIFF